MSYLVQFGIACGAFGWLVHRCSQIGKKSTEELISILGVELSAPPSVSLAEIKADSVNLRWNPPVDTPSGQQYNILVNGCSAGSPPWYDGLFTVSGLSPNTLYSIRIVARKHGTFQGSSNIIRVQTQALPPGSHSRRGSTLGDSQAAGTAQARDKHDGSLQVRVHGLNADPLVFTSVGTASSKDLNGSSYGKKITQPRRNSPPDLIEPASPAFSDGDRNDGSEEPVNYGETLEQLQAALERLQRETEEVQLQISKDDQDFQNSRTELAQLHESLKQDIKAKEDSSADLKKDLTKLERASRAIAKERKDKEQQLQQKQGERRKMGQDLVRWEKEMNEIQKKAEQIENDKIRYQQEAERQIDEFRAKLQEEQEIIPTLEEEVKAKGIEIKALDEERKRLFPDEAGSEVNDRVRVERENEAHWLQKQAEARNKLSKVYKAHEKALQDLKTAQGIVEFWRNQFYMHGLPLITSTTEADTNGTKRLKHRRSRQRKSRSSTNASTQGFSSTDSTKGASGPIFAGLSTGIPSSYTSSPPYYNTVAGQKLGPLNSHPPIMNKADADTLAGGALISPTAAGYLPSGLLGDDAESFDADFKHLQGSSPFTMNNFGVPFGLDAQLIQSPNSPHSSESRSTSRWSSPRTSLQNLAHHPSGSDSFIDTDKRSLNSNHASLGAIGESSEANVSSARRLSNLFHLGRQRGKNLDAEPPLFGSLKAGQSQSFPRNYQQQQQKLDPIGTRARSGSHSNASVWGGGLVGSVGNLLNRRGTSPLDSTEGNGPAAARYPPYHQGSRYAQFRSDSDPFEPSKLLGHSLPSPRPASTSSHENLFPAPSIDSQPFGWGARDTAGPLSRRGPFSSGDWSMHSDAWSSGVPSRRQSLNQPSASSTSLGRFSTVSEGLHEYNSTRLIGSPEDSHGTTNAQTLNPTAPAFSFNLFRSDANKKAEKAEKAAETGKKKKEKIKMKDKERDKEKERDKDKDKELSSVPEDASPDNHRRSRDSRSINTETTETSESHESLDRSISGTPSEGGQTPSAREKSETFMQKLSRKSSSSKFNIPWKDKSSLFSKKSTEPSTPGEPDDENMFDSQQVKSVESPANSPNIGTGAGRKSWSIISRKQRKERALNDEKATDASEKANETGDDEEESEK